MWIAVIIGLGVVTALVQLALHGLPSDPTYVISTLLLHQFVVTHGIVALIGFYMNVIDARRSAAHLGWPGGPFQVKYGFSQLGLGIMGVLCIWLRGNFWAATLITLYIYGGSGLVTHTQEILRKRRESGITDRVEVGNIVLDVIYHLVLTAMSLFVPGVWSTR